MQIDLTFIDVFAGIRKGIVNKTDFAITAKSSGEINAILIRIACISVVYTLIDICDRWAEEKEKLFFDDKSGEDEKFVDSPTH
jgi:hypothetical protein